MDVELPDELGLLSPDDELCEVFDEDDCASLVVVACEVDGVTSLDSADAVLPP